jgi:prepilin-type N-terminal cleavage/methylation domain-containing protein
MIPARTQARRGFTLIELLVVIGIITLVAVLGYMLLPSLSGDYNRVRSLETISGCLLNARMRAKRDGLPTGVRLVVGSNGLVNQLQYIQQPEPLTSQSAFVDDMPASTTRLGVCNGLYPAGTAMPANQIYFTYVDFVGAGTAAGAADALVQPGDYLELDGGGPVRAITGVTYNPPSPPSPPPTATALTLLSAMNVFVPTSSWRILRQPRPLVGEDIQQLPGDYVVDYQNMPPGQQSLNVPTRTVGGTTYYEILFSPAGSVIGPGSSYGKIVLYVHDTSTTSTLGPPGLIAINTRTGFIGAYDVAPGADPYLFTEDGRSGGL